MEKTCRRCNETKPIDQFQIDARLKDGHTNLCKPCASKYANEWHHKNREHHNQKMYEWRERLKKVRPEKVVLSSARKRAKLVGRAFTITAGDLHVPDYCPVFGTKLEFGKGCNSPNSPSIDAVIPELGYVPGNVVVISHRANSIKQNATPEELRKVADWLEEQLRTRPS